MTDDDAAERARGSAAPSGRRLVRQTVWFGLGQAANDLTFYVMILVLAALVSPHDFGSVALGMAIVRVAYLLTQAGVGGSIIASRGLTLAQVRAARRGILVPAVAFSVVMALVASPVARTFAPGSDPDVLRVLGIAVTLSALSIVPTAVLRKSIEMRRIAGINAGSAIVTATVAIAAALAGAGVWALVVRQLVYEGLLALLLSRAARGIVAELPAGAPRASRRDRPPHSLAFLVVSASALGALTLDNMVVGAATNAAQLGFYSLAFTFGFAPLTQVSWRLGQVLFPATAATDDLAVVTRRTLSLVRITGLLLFPLVPVAVVLAPVLIPAVLGHRWTPMVAPFQVLLVVGVAYGVSNTIGEAMSGTGGIVFRARIEPIYAVGALALVAVLATVDGIRGAAIGHVIAYLPLAAVYVVRGTRLIGSSAAELWRVMRGIVGALAAQASVTAAVWAALSGLPAGLGAALAALAGLAVWLLVVWRAPSAPLEEARKLVAVARGRGRPAAAGS